MNKVLRSIVAFIVATVTTQQVFEVFLKASSNQFVAGTIAVSMFIIVLIFVYDNFGRKDEAPPDQPS